MSDRYLWDRTGKPDPEVERLERALRPLAHPGAPLELPEPEISRARRRGGALPAWALAAAALAIVAGGAWLWSGTRDWEVARVAGAPRLEERPLAPRDRARAGDLLVTDGSSSARVNVGRIGVVEVGPNSRLRILGRRGVVHRMALDQGVLHAAILAPPRRFVVDTPSARAVDLGCIYTLEVDPRGAALLTVVAGWVSFEHQGRESFIPAGARCATRLGQGPGTPYFTDASTALKNALVLVDLAAPSGDVPDSSLRVLLAEARRVDAFTVWHLLVRLPGPDRALVFERLSALVPPPAGVTRSGVLSGDRRMLDAWWDSLGLGGTQDWRRWKGPLPGA